jgi:branched-chain amino acid transport system ATP-binding protein
VSLAVEEAQVVAIVGPNGAGKTTLLSAVQGLIRPKAGRIAFGGHDITGRPPHELVRAGIVQVPEGRRILGRLTVLENLLVGAHHRRDAGEIRRDLDAILNRFPVLRDKSGVGAGLLSGGEQQMLAIGRALMARPRLLLLDEPSMGLAPLFVIRVFEFIRELNTERGLAVLLVEQNARRALDAATHACVLSAGRIVAAGSPASIRGDASLVSAYLGGEMLVGAR